MSKTNIKSAIKPLALATLLGTSLLAGTQAWASTGAGAGILNTATVNYNDVSGTAQAAISSSVTVTVKLVAAAPTVSSPTGVQINPGTSTTYTYYITNNANGVMPFTLSTADSNSSGLNATTTAPSSTYAVVAGTGTLPLPTTQQGTGLNGLTNGAVVLMGNSYYTVSGVPGTTTGAANTTTTITLTPVTVNGVAPSAQTLSSGTLIDEVGEVKQTVTPGTYTTGGELTNQTETDTLTATDPNSGTDGISPVPQTTPTVTTVGGAGLTVTKFVRNATTQAAGTGTTASIIVPNDPTNSSTAVTFYTAGVTGSPGDVLEYLIQVSTLNASTNFSKSVSVTDVINDFLVYQTGTALQDTTANCTGSLVTATHFAATAVSGSANPTLSFYVGSGATSSAGGQIGSSSSTVTCSMTYQTKVQ